MNEKIDHEALTMERIKHLPGAHYCKDWDYLAIHWRNEEADSCHCSEHSWRFRRELWRATWGIVKCAGFITGFRTRKDETVIYAAPLILQKKYFWLTGKNHMIERLEEKGYEVKLVETWQEFGENEKE